MRACGIVGTMSFEKLMRHCLCSCSLFCIFVDRRGASQKLMRQILCYCSLFFGVVDEHFIRKFLSNSLLLRSSHLCKDIKWSAQEHH
mmetsp:Transcript_37056/g.80694  ORF Transcript_37056/g.80694 Transcript_37056/m.80694 type:complete len:87 (+) Transcript_37056:535-795(+)